MEQLLDFASNNLLLVAAFFIVLGLIIKMEVERKVSGTKNLSPMEATRLLSRDEALMLDVRDDSEYKSGHIKNAVHIPVDALNERLGEIEKHKDKPVIVYCRTGIRSRKACTTLKKAGFGELYRLDGGVVSWESANLPLTKK